MPRPIVLGNGTLTVTLDEDQSIRDLYFPFVGQFNHVSGHRCRVGIWTSDHGFAWIDGESDRSLSYRDSSLVTNNVVINRALNVALRFEQAVDPEEPYFLQRIAVENLSESEREIRLFFAYDLRIAESDIGDTAFYNPFLSAMVHYKRDFYFLVAGQVGESWNEGIGGIAQYACGVKEFGGAEGAWRDAEDGHLSGNAIAQGSVDSVVGFHLPVAGKETKMLRVWLAAGENLNKVADLQQRLLARGFDPYFEDAETLSSQPDPNNAALIANLPKDVRILYYRSLALIKAHVDRRGAIIASLDSDIMKTARAHYAYTWPRDGALVASALDRAGQTADTTTFFRFCTDAVQESLAHNYWKRGAALMHKYGPDGTIGSSWHPWVVPGAAPEPPIQEDGTALVVWSAVKHCETVQDQHEVRILYDRLIFPAAEFLSTHRDDCSGLPLASWDVWEERRGIHIFTVSAVVGALSSASRLAAQLGKHKSAEQFAAASEEILTATLEEFWDSGTGRFARMLLLDADGTYIKDLTVDSSAFALFAYAGLSPSHPKVAATMEAVGKSLWVKTRTGGLARYHNDYYFRVTDDLATVPGNPWIICTLWLAEWAIANAKSTADLGPALDLLVWTTLRTLETGVLPEQVHPITGDALSVAPLTWSHAQFVTTTLNYIQKMDDLTAA